MLKQRSRLYQELIGKSWWVIAFVLVCFLVYDQMNHHLKKERGRLTQKLESLEIAKAEAHEKQAELRWEIQSQNDAAYLELVLMRKLGLVPEGGRKVVFTDRESK